MRKKANLFTDKSFLQLEISLSTGLDDMPPITWGLLFSHLFVLLLSVWMWESVSQWEQQGWVHAAGEGPFAHPAPGSPQHRGASPKLASKTAAERRARTEYFLQFVFVQEVESFLIFFFNIFIGL